MTTAREDSVRLADLLSREHNALAEFLIALAAFDRERRWIDLGYTSSFYFLHRELGLSKGAAYYRKTAAELIQRHPEVLEALREGKLCLTSIVELSKVITAENLAEVLPRFFHVSKREAKEVTAELLPAAAPALRTVVTTVRSDVGEPPVAVAIPAQPSPCSPDPLADDLVHPANLGHANAHVPVGSSALPPAPLASPGRAPAARDLRAARTQVEPLTAELSRIHVTVPRRLLEKLARARDALSHSHAGASDDEILEVGLDLVIARHAKRRGIGAKPRKLAAKEEPACAPAKPSAAASTPGPAEPPRATAPAAREGHAATAAPAPTRRSRHVPAHVWRAVWQRDQGRCVWPIEGGGVCGATRRLELDHLDGWALGAETSVERCRLLCDTHNDVHARELYGDDHMNEFTRPKRGPRCSEPVATYAPAPPASRARCDVPRLLGWRPSH